MDSVDWWVGLGLSTRPNRLPLRQRCLLNRSRFWKSHRTSDFLPKVSRQNLSGLAFSSRVAGKWLFTPNLLFFLIPVQRHRFPSTLVLLLPTEQAPKNKPQEEPEVE
jgi:hypothetical protein|tara:strand:- start:70 stop:390 length:321 start_codon:yes stop_codon:yes gene_type:complete